MIMIVSCRRTLSPLIAATFALESSELTSPRSFPSPHSTVAVLSATQENVKQFKPTMTLAQLPKSLDYTNSGYDNFGMVKTQADCGSCW